MPLIDKLLSHAIPLQSGRKRVLARVLLDERGVVQDVVLKRSCGDPACDAEALRILRERRYAPARTGNRAVRRWHEIAYSFD
ncbi:TonB family protein [Burkholderia cepacia]|uniref:TonB family protein n=1 Tax=Burkholderia cepacia TaxID=292 RepID=UPI00158990BA|nr:TonB family protein [Burkholderia cepacia]